MKSILLTLLTAIPIVLNAQIYQSSDGEISLKGVAPKETITALSKHLKGKLDPSTREFNFRQSLSHFSFSQGEMQKKDAEEVYWEIHKYPNASFKGKIINDVDLTQPGIHRVTAQGVLSMHGVDKDVKIPALVKVTGSLAQVSASFEVFLSDYNIKIPRLVVLKVSEKFEVKVSMKMKI
jgi:hypothetical protein